MMLSFTLLSLYIVGQRRLDRLTLWGFAFMQVRSAGVVFSLFTSYSGRVPWTPKELMVEISRPLVLMAFQFRLCAFR